MEVDGKYYLARAQFLLKLMDKETLRMVYLEPRHGNVMHNKVEISKATDSFGFKPSVG